MLYEGTQKEERVPGVSLVDMPPGSSMSRYVHMILMARRFLSLVGCSDNGPWCYFLSLVHLELKKVLISY